MADDDKTTDKKPMEALIRKRIGEIPILQTVIQRLRLREILLNYIKPHGNETVPAVDTLLVLVWNIACGRQPLYELPEWVAKLDGGLLGHRADAAENPYGDDRFGRALDKLYAADRASMVTDIALRVIETTGVDLSELHNDSTTVKSFGSMPGKTATGLYFTQGHSKDHRPDLKQIVYNLTISADGAIPIHYKTYPGNRTDDTLHIETWNALRRITGTADFLYVADCKVCTHKQLSHIVRHGGRVVTLMPETWKETGDFKATLRQTAKAKKRILRRRLPNDEEGYETFYCFSGQYRTEKGRYPLHWIYSTQKKKRDRVAREKRLQKAEYDLTELMGKLNTRALKTKDQIQQRVQKILQGHGVETFYHTEIGTVKQQWTKQIGKGRPGKNTQYETIVETLYTLSWRRNREALDREKKVDGIFPILCTDEAMTAKSALEAYKYQPRLEKRFCQLKSVHNVAPTLFKRVERVEAIMLLFFLALILQAIIEREVRQTMKDSDIDALSIYPEHRLAYHPTTAKIFERFRDISNYRIV
ncbi:MAG: IS1634 family transposase, partial [bacterium]|nr:IS1634 family transposase [bacterium]